MSFKKENELAVLEKAPSFLQHLQETEDKRGNENITMEDVKIPRLMQVQGLSECKIKTHPDYIEGALDGMLYNSLTREVYGEDVLMCFGHMDTTFVIWNGNKKGALCFAGSFDTEIEAKEAASLIEGKQDKIKVKRTHNHYGIVINGQTGVKSDILFSMGGSKLKRSKAFNSIVQHTCRPRFERVYKIRAIFEQAEQGDFFNVKIDPAGYPSEDVYARAVAVYTMVNDGLVTIDAAVEE